MSASQYANQLARQHLAGLSTRVEQWIAEARGAIRNRNVAVKGAAIGRALRIVDEGPSAALNLQEGGALAADLHSLYGYLALRLTHANLRNDDAALEECTRLVDTLRGAWSGIAGQIAR